MGTTVTKEIIPKVLDIKIPFEGKSLQDVAAQVQQQLCSLENTTLNIAITGVSGAEKSSLVNALCGVADDGEGAAKTGVGKPTKEPGRYPHPKFSNVVLWDLPGIGTPHFKADAYLQQVNFSQYDFFFIVSSDHFTKHDVKLAYEIQKMEKKFYFVRTKIDVSLYRESRTRSFSEEAVLEQIRKSCVPKLRKAKGFSPEVFLISIWELGRYDFPRLQNVLEDDLDDLKRQTIIMALPVYSKEVLEKKKAVMESLIWKKSLLSCAIGALPVPGLSFACDLVILVHEMQQFYRVFGLDPNSLENLAKKLDQPVTELLSAMKKCSLFEKITKEFVIQRMNGFLGYSAATTLEESLKFIPIIGSVAGAGLSFATTHCTLKSFLNDVVEDAENVLAKTVELSMKNLKSRKQPQHPFGKRR